MKGSDATIFALFVGAGVLTLAWNLFFLFSKDAPRKRKLFRAGVLFITPVFGLGVILFAIFLARAPLALLIFLPALALIAFINLKTVKFCDRCGATLYNSNWFVPMRYCSRCGAELTQ